MSNPEVLITYLYMGKQHTASLAEIVEQIGKECIDNTTLFNLINYNGKISPNDPIPIVQTITIDGTVVYDNR